MPLPPKATLLIMPLPPKATTLIMPLPPKATPLIRTDFRCTVIVQYYCIVPLKRGYPSYKTRLSLQKNWSHTTGITNKQTYLVGTQFEHLTLAKIS